MPAEPQIVIVETEPADPDARYRRVCGQQMAQVMRLRGVTRKELAARMREAGNEVSPAAIGHWLTGFRLPRPHLQVAIAAALDVTPDSIFDIKKAAA